MINEPSYSIPDDASTWPYRIERACQVLEQEFGLRLALAHAYQDGRPPEHLSDRLSYLRKKARTRKKWLAIYCGTGPANKDYYSVTGCSYGNRGVYNCSALFPETALARQEALLVSLGDALAAYSAQYTPPVTAKRLYLVQWCCDNGSIVTKEKVEDLTEEERRLPLLLNTWYGGLQSPLQPHWLGWLNYWSAEVADYLGFPDPQRDHDLLRCSYRTPAGAWLVKLDAEPLDAANPTHVAWAAEVYQRFPRLGARTRTEPQFIHRTYYKGGPASP